MSVSAHSNRSVKSSSDIYKHLYELEGIQRSQQLQILKQKILFWRHTSIASFSSGSRIEAMVRVSACPSLNEGLSRGQMFPGQMLAVSCCKMLPLESSHCFGMSRRHGILVVTPNTDACQWIIDRVSHHNQPFSSLWVPWLSIRFLEFKNVYGHHLLEHTQSSRRM